jgi:hypothetical protein
MFTKKVLYFILLSLYFGLSGCASYKSYNGVKFISPQYKAFHEYGEVVNSLTPELTWEADKGEYYDVKVWDAVACHVQGKLLTGRGNPVIYKEYIQGGSYRVDPPLQPKRVYYWSVRKHGATQWSRFTRRTDIYMPYVSGTQYNQLFSFETPDKP